MAGQEETLRPRPRLAQGRPTRTGMGGHGAFGTRLPPLRTHALPRRACECLYPQLPSMERAERACACSDMDRVIPQYVITLVRVLSYTSGPTSARSLVSHADSVMSALAWLGVRAGRGNGGVIGARRTRRLLVLPSTLVTRRRFGIIHPFPLPPSDKCPGDER